MLNRTVLLINPRATYAYEIAQKCYPPLNLLYLASALKNHGFTPVMLDANAFLLSDSAIAEEVLRLNPLLIGIPLYSDILRQVRDMINIIHETSPNIPIVLGGPHSSAIPEDTIRQYPTVSYVLTGEAEESLPMLCNAISNNSDDNYLSKIPGIFFRKMGSVIKGPLSAQPDVHKLAMPSRELMTDAYNKKRYYTLMVRSRPVDTIITSRGCPFHCGFCYSHNFEYRARTPESVVDELASIREHGIRNVEICDDNFTADHSRALKIFDLIIKERLDISFRIKSRVDVFTEQLAKKAKKAGVYLVAFGMESGSQHMLDIMQKKIKVADCRRVCELTRKYGILSHTSWIIGYPGETPDSVNETVTFIKKNRPDTVNISVIRPYPGTLAYELAKEKGNLVGDWDPDCDITPWIRLPWAKERQVIDNLCRRIRRQIYFSPHYITSFANRIIRNSNWTLAKYAIQETFKVIR